MSVLRMTPVRILVNPNKSQQHRAGRLLTRRQSRTSGVARAERVRAGVLLCESRHGAVLLT